MANYIYGAIALTGGSTGSLDSLDGDDLTDNDAAIVFTANSTYIYTLDPTVGGAESSPDVIAPDTNAGNKRWVLVKTNSSQSSVDVSSFAGVLDASDDTVQKALDTIDDLFSTNDFVLGAGAVSLNDSVLKGIGTNTGAMSISNHAANIYGAGRLSTNGNGNSVTMSLADFDVITKSSNYTILATDDIIIGDTSGGNITLTLPNATTKDIIRISKKSSSNDLTIACYGSQTIQSNATIVMENEYDSATLVSDGVNTWIIMGGSMADSTYA